ncbi:MAG: DNA-binding transcriptional regulator [Verrucomicrobiae bacterium]|jgi:LacI family transcriptional regulator|nr:DNA-binding transcriptional regulator [Verrucomicrobiae bacterium]
MRKRSDTIPRVAILVESTRTYTRELLAGVKGYVAKHGPWNAFLELRALDSTPPPWLRTWHGDGILSRTFTQRAADLISATGIPTVELRSTRLKHSFPFVGVDNSQVGRMVAEHFLDRGYTSFGVYALPTENFFEERVENFRAALKARGHPCPMLTESGSDRVSDWERNQARLKNWLSALPKPAGVFAANDQLGLRLLEACQTAGIKVPDEIAVVGCENEELLCAFASPTLTSVQFDGFAVGYRAAELLDTMIRKRRTKRTRILVPAKQIVIRESSDVLAIKDQLVARAVRIIRQQAMAGINVKQVCEQLNASRSTLERRMKASMGRNPKEEILRHRCREVERLLRDTDMTIEAIADQTGFVHGHHLQRVFKQRFRQTPGQFRGHFRQPAD